MKICNVDEMRNLDRRAIKEYGITQEILMENAGQASYFTILKEFGIKNKNFVCFCGVGNNGGDGLVVARKLYSNGGKVTVFILGDRSKFQGAAKQNFNIVNKLQIKIIKLQDVSLALETISSSDAIIDAIFGTGLDREVKGQYMGVFLHGFAGDLAAKDKGEDGLIASNIMDQLPASLKAYREGSNTITKDYYHSIYIL